jgi:hypothetical protein
LKTTVARGLPSFFHFRGLTSRHLEQAGQEPMTLGRTPAARFEISIDGVPRNYRDQKDLALLGAQLLKFKNPHSVVRLKDLKTGEEIVIAFKAAQQ